MTLPAELEDARESLAYWERRWRQLPRRAVRRRREARRMAATWRQRVVAEEREAYGAGVGGALVQWGSERRVPLRVRRTARHVARRSAHVVLAVTAVSLTLLVLALVLVIELLRAL